MQVSFIQAKILLRRISVLLLVYSVLRLLFFIFNREYFPFSFFSSILPAFLLGIRFDISAIVYANLLFIILHLIPVRAFYKKYYQKILRILFYVCNIPLIILNCVDFVYFRFTLKRTTWDLFTNLGMSDDFLRLLPSMIRDFWYLIVIAALVIFLMSKLYQRIQIPDPSKIKKTRSLFWQIVLNLAIALVLVIGSRGGLQYRPLNLLNAAQFTNPSNAPLILNTSFSILKTLGRMELLEANYFPPGKLESFYKLEHPGNSDSTFKNLNVIVIIMESFSKEFTGSYPLKKKSFTPFLDSLSQYSLVCTNAFANGKKSIDGIPSILAGLPSMMNESYITSAYSGNKINSLASLLQAKGYETSFFHGGVNGTMGFDGFIKMAGFDKYYGKSEYPFPSDYDGDWGIYDEPFFQFFNTELAKMKQPFFSSVFTLSSHHPYNVPAKYRNKFPEENLPIYRSLRYADYSLRQFFKSAEKQDWYKNTLFVITADHTSPGEIEFYQNQVGAYAIPLIFYRPGNDLSAVNNMVTQQMDIMPSILSYLNYDKEYSAFGSSIFSKQDPHFAMNYMNGIYQFISDGYALQFDGTKFVSLYHFETDSLLRNNLINTKNPSVEKLQDLCKAIVQTYNHSMIHNKMIQH